jgi:hypothetical protein
LNDERNYYRGFPVLRRSWIIYAAGFIQIILLSCRPLVISSNRAGQSIVIDGKERDWQSVPLHHFEAWDAAIGICNDSDFLYLMMLIKNPMLIMQARSRGMMLEFSDPGHRDPLLTIQYTGVDSLHPIFEPEDSFWQCLNEDQRKQMVHRRMRLKDRITVTRAEQSLLIPPDGSRGPSAARIYDHTFTGYELKIPIRPQSAPSFSVGLDAGTAVDIRIRPGERSPDSGRGQVRGGGEFMPRSPMGRGGSMVPGKAEIRFRLILSH